MKSVRSSVLSLTCFAALSIATVVQAQTPSIRIMPLGDSITDGSGAAGGYRLPLYIALTNAGYNVDLVGTATDNSAPGLGTEVNHEGHGGWRITSPVNGLYDFMYSWFEAIEDPHVILLHIGTNDSGGFNANTNDVNNLDKLITRLTECQPSAQIIVTSLMKRDEPNYTLITNYFNPYVPGKVARQQGLGRHVTFLDMHAYVELTDMPDHLHPNAGGYQKMANAWFPAITNVIGTNVTANLPAPIRAIGAPNYQQVSISFNKKLSYLTATNSANYSITNVAGSALAITGASLSADQRTVTLATAVQTKATNYVITVNNVADTNSPALTVPANTRVSFQALTPRGYTNNVVDSAGYTMLYSFDIPTTPNYGSSTVAYSVDNSARIGRNIGRVAYYMELQQSGGDLQYVWASMDAFTNDVKALGVPTLLSGALFQRYVTNLKVESNQAGVTPGSGYTGNLEFWPYNYTQANALGIPGASASYYDFGDQCSFSANYGSMQVHNTTLGKTLFGFNKWGGAGGNADLGIGSRTDSGDADWTTAGNAGNYTVKTLQVFVKLDASDTTPPVPVSALTGIARTAIAVTFNESLLAASVSASCFSVSGGAQVYSATLLSDLRTVRLITAPLPTGTALTLNVVGVRDLAGNPVPAGTTVTIPATVPQNVADYAGSLANGYELVYALDIPVTGNFNGTPDFYRLNQSAFTGQIDRVAYYVELQKADATVQYLWTSMDAFTNDTRKIGVPTAASGAVFQQYVSNLVVKSNVSGVSNGTFAAGGYLEFWPTDYGASNAMNVAGASNANCDFGDERRTTGTHGSMQVHNVSALQTLFGMSNWGADNQTLGLGIGNCPSPVSGGVDWTFSANAGTAYGRRTLYVLVHKKAATVTTLPPAVVANVPDVANYQLAYTINLPVNGSFNNDAAAAAYYTVNNATNGLAPTFSRIAYYLELVPTGSSVTQYVWTAMDAFTTDARKIGIPTTNNACFFQQKVLRLDVRSNVGGIVTGSNIDTGNIEIWPSNYGGGNGLPIPNADNTHFDFGDSGGSGNSLGYGCLQVHNFGLGATQTLFAVNNFNNNGILCVGIGTCTNPASSNGSYGYDWTFKQNAGSFSSRILHVFVLPGICDTVDTTRPTLFRAIAAKSLNQVAARFSETLSDSAATASFFTLNNGATVSAAQLSADKKEVVLTTSALTAGQTYTLTVTGVRDRSSNANAIMPGSTIAFTAPTATVPTVLTNVAEASGYDLIQQLAVANTTYYANGAAYTIDESLSPRTNGFDRIAYCMELTGTNGVAKWVYVSMDAFTADITKIGVPTADRGVIWQQYVSNLNVYASANVANISVTTGVGIAVGNVEFWPSSYTAANDKSIPGASATTFDFGDGGANGTTAGHGSMQVHNFAAGHTILAMNHFGTDGMVPALGIGNNPNWATLNDPDWTQTANASTYSVKNLYVLARPCASFPLVGTPPSIWGQPASASAYLGETARFNVYAPDATAFQWRKNGVLVAGATQSWLDFPSATLADAGAYDVLVTGPTGNTLSQSATLSVYAYTRPQAPRPLRIMPLGDSITYGASTAGGYRLPLYVSLTNAGYNVDYVGTRNDNGAAGLPDSDHEGLSGWTIGQLDSNIIDWLFAINDPDVVLLHIGTNDSGGGNAFTNAVDRLDNLVSKIATNRPNANIIVTSLMPRGEPNNAAITNYFNPYIPGKVAAQRALGRKVFFLDMHAYLTTNDMYDTPPLHPSATGYAKMAAAWYASITNIVGVYGDSSAPVVVRGVNTANLQGVAVTFSKQMEPASATNIANYALTGGLTISGASLSDDQRTVTLATSPLTKDALYTVTATGVKDYSWPVQQTIATTNSDSFRATVRGYLANVPEAAGYKLAYAIDLPNTPAYGTTPITYSKNNTLLFSKPPKRVAYYLELQRLDGDLQYLWVSMDAFTDDITKIGIPAFPTGAFFQKSVANMNVVCNDTNVISGTGLTGNIEFWPCNYTSGSSGLPTGANDGLFDFGDTPTTGGTYGSMQVHNTLAGKTLFGINNWGSGGSVLDIGIGNCPTPINSGVDWTFQNNGINVPLRSLYVLVSTDADTTPPTLVSAQAGTAGTLVVVTFSEALAADSLDGSRFTLDHGVSVISATLLPGQRIVNLVTTPQPVGTTLTLTVNGVFDLGGGNPIAPNSTITVVAPALPPRVVAAAGSLANGYELVYSLDIPVTGTFNGTADPYYYNQSLATGSFDRVAYYFEVVPQNTTTLPPGNLTTQYVWTAMDAFTTDRKKIAVPTAASQAIFQQVVTNLVVKSNVSGISNDTFVAGGNIEFWPTDYTGANALGIANASGSYFDFGDTRLTTGTHGSMQVHNAGQSTVLFAMNNWGADGQTIELGIGNRPGNNDKDWTAAVNAGSYARRTLHVMVHPTAPTVPYNTDTNAPALTGASASRSLDKVSLTFSETLSDRAALDGTFALNNGASVISATLQSDKKTIVLATSPLTAEQNYVVTVSGVRDRSSNGNLIAAGSTANFTTPPTGLPTVLTSVPEIGGYSLVYQLAVGNTNNYANGCNYTVDESRFAVTQAFDRVSYCMELVTAAGVSNWVYVSMNAFTNDLTKIGVPTANRGAMFQQYVSNLNVYASANASVTTGTGIPAGNIEFWPSDYTAANTLNIPGASATAYDFGDGGASGTSAGHGSMQVHNFAAGQTLFAMDHFGRDGYVPALGIGNQPTGDPDWTFNYNAPSFSVKNIYVLVRWSALPPSQGVGPDIYVQPKPTAKFSGQNATFYVQAVGATAYQWRCNGVWIPGATRSVLELTPATRSNIGSYDVLVYNGFAYTVSQSAALTIFPGGTYILLR